MDHTIVHFEIPADDVSRAKKFYGEVFGWDIALMPGPFEYYGVTTTAKGESGMPTGPGVNGGMYKRMKPGQSPINYIGVEDIDAYTSKLVEAGGEVVVPKMPVPGHGWMIHFKDPEGNMLALWQPDPSAAAA
jgi:predicted enzyme related to lactoylglutathione lyase